MGAHGSDETDFEYYTGSMRSTTERSIDALVGAFSRLVANRAAEVLLASPSRRSTIGEVDALSRALADRIAASNLPHGGLTGLAAPNGPAFLAGFLALRRAGQTAFFLDPLAPAEDRRRIVTALGASAVLECASAWPGSAADFRLARAEHSIAPPELPGVATVMLTSGSTGVARGVTMRAENLMADEAALAVTMGFRAEDRLVAAIPMSHSYGFTTLVLSAILRGLRLVIPDDQGPLAPLDAARELDATVFPTVPAYLQAVVRMSDPPAWPQRIRLVISAGALLPAATAAQFRETYAQPVHAFYGSSECGGICYDREGGAAERGTVGSPVEGVRVSLKPLASEEEGEGIVVVESASVGDTYLPLPDVRLAAGRFETSDLGSWCGEELELRGRVDHVINVRGWKVDPSEVERVLLMLDGVEEAIVMGVASPEGRGDMVRAVIACPSGRLDYPDVVRWCRSHLADHKVPRSVVIVDAIPRTSRGKIDRSTLVRLGGSGEGPRDTHD